MINRKIKNATPTIYNGRQYRSKLETRFARMLDENHISFTYEAETWEIVPKQKYLGKTVRAVTYTPDFIIGDVVVEIKGFRNDVFPLKKKLIIKFINESKPDTVFIEARTVADMTDAVNLILQKQNLKSKCDG